MRIAFIGQKGIPARGGGIERYADDLARHLVRRGHEVIAYTRPYYTDPSLTEYEGVRLVSLPTIRTKHLDAIIHTFLSLLDAARRDVEIIHFQNIGPALLAWLPRLIAPRARIVSIYQSQDYKHQKWGAFARFSLKLGERLMFIFSHEVIAVTEVMKRYAREHFGADVHVVPNGANFSDPDGGDLIRVKWGLRPGNYIAYIGRLIRHKGVHLLISAYKQIKTDQPLIIVGDGNFTDGYVEELRALAAEDDRIVFLGNQEGKILKELYTNSSVFVLPSESEGLSLALLEALSYGLPVLLSDIPENLEGAGEYGHYFTNKSASSLRERLEYILSHPEECREQAARGAVWARERYDWARIAREIESVYEQALVRGKAMPDNEVAFKVSRIS